MDVLDLEEQKRLRATCDTFMLAERLMGLFGDCFAELMADLAGSDPRIGAGFTMSRWNLLRMKVRTAIMEEKYKDLKIQTPALEEA